MSRPRLCPMVQSEPVGLDIVPLPRKQAKNRPKVHPVVRAIVLKRDEHRCRYCGLGLDMDTMTIDHVVPLAKGGKNKQANMVASCWDCNQNKGDGLDTPPGWKR